MRAVVKMKSGEGFIEISETDKPKIKPDEVLIKVNAAAICGSDVGIYRWSKPFHKTPIPIILGHEYAGEIAEIGELVENFKVGDRVTGFATIGCGLCTSCKMGKTNHCINRVTFGVHSNGAFAEYLNVPSKYVFKLPMNVSYIEASPIEAFATAVHAVLEQRIITPESNVVIFGPGPIGLFTVQLLNLIGVKKITILGTSYDKRRLDLAKELGAEKAINVSDIDSVTEIKDQLGNDQVDLVFEASGSNVALKQSIDLIKRGGEILLIGIGQTPTEVLQVQLVREAITIKGVYANTPETFVRSLKLLENRQIDIEKVITDIMVIEDIIDGLERFMKKESGKVVLKIGD